MLFRSGKMGNLSIAFDTCQILIEQEPKNLGYWEKYSELAVILRKLEQAINGLENVIFLTSNGNPEILSILAVLYYENAEYQKADSILTDLYLQGQRDSHARGECPLQQFDDSKSRRLQIELHRFGSRQELNGG